MTTFFQQLMRGLLLRCPVCGQGKLFNRPFKMHEKCPQCNFVYEREEGYFTSSMAVNLVISELLIAAFIVPLAADTRIPLTPLLIFGAPFPILLPLIFFHHSRGIWMSMDHLLNPVQRV